MARLAARFLTAIGIHEWIGGVAYDTSKVPIRYFCIMKTVLISRKTFLKRAVGTTLAFGLGLRATAAVPKAKADPKVLKAADASKKEPNARKAANAPKADPVAPKTAKAPKEDIVVKKSTKLAAQEKDSFAGKSAPDSGSWGATTYNYPPATTDCTNSPHRETSHPAISISPGGKVVLGKDFTFTEKKTVTEKK